MNMTWTLLVMPLMLSTLGRAELPPQITTTYTGPASVTAKIGDVLVRIDGPKLWTLSRIEYKGTLLGVEESAYGTVVNIKDVGFIGSAHKENETEQVLGVRFLLDGKEVTRFDSELSGTSFVVERQSRIRSMDFDARLEVRDNKIFQGVRIRNSKDVAMDKVYPFMYAWTPQATEYLFGADAAKTIEGVFRQNVTGKADYLVHENVDWASVYVGEKGIGAVMRTLSQPTIGNAAMLIADGPTVYRKWYSRYFTEQTLPAGFDGTYRVVTGFLESDQPNWKSGATAMAQALKAEAAAAGAESSAR